MILYGVTEQRLLDIAATLPLGYEVRLIGQEKDSKLKRREDERDDAYLRFAVLYNGDFACPHQLVPVVERILSEPGMSLTYGGAYRLNTPIEFFRWRTSPHWVGHTARCACNGYTQEIRCRKRSNILSRSELRVSTKRRRRQRAS